MKKWLIHSYTDYCGTDSYEVVEAESEYDAKKIGYDIACENANSYYTTISIEDFEIYEYEGRDMQDYITDEQFGFAIEPYDENLHADLI